MTKNASSFFSLCLSMSFLSCSNSRNDSLWLMAYSNTIPSAWDRWAFETSAHEESTPAESKNCTFSFPPRSLSM
uniref:Putative secreted protein n=1 Tax=Ixodes ricinus TaxID=34613 RepID=A0A6B0UAL2_IXORI